MIRVNRERKSFILSLLFLAAVVASYSSFAGNCNISKAIDDVLKAKTPGQRSLAAEELYKISASAQPRGIDPGTVEKIAGLLKSDDWEVAYWSARALGSFGGESRDAVPELTAALHKYECVKASKSPASGIVMALHQIMGRPEEALMIQNCSWKEPN